MDKSIAREASAPEFGRNLKGFGINLLVKDIGKTTAFLKEILGMEIHRADQDFAVLEHDGNFFQLHADHTYHDNPLPETFGGTLHRGGGVELRLYQKDPDACEARAKKNRLQSASHQPRSPSWSVRVLPVRSGRILLGNQCNAREVSA